MLHGFLLVQKACDALFQVGSNEGLHIGVVESDQLFHQRIGKQRPGFVAFLLTDNLNQDALGLVFACLLYTSPSPRDS